MDSRFDWVPFFEELAKKLSQYRNNQGALIQVLREAGVEKGLDDQSPKKKNIPLTEIDPFTFFALVIKYKKFAERTLRFESIKNQLALTAAAPKSFDGVPSSDPRNSWFFSYKYGREAHDIERLWSLFSEALAGVITNDTLQKAMDVKQAGKAKLTQAMFWVSPNHLLPVDKQTRPFLKALDIQSDFTTAADYMSMCNDAIQKTGKPPYAISYDAYEMNQNKTPPPPPLPPPPHDALPKQTNHLPRSTQHSSLNVILYGPPGTGKTYATKALAVEICDGSKQISRSALLSRYEQLRAMNRIEFVTFHQSFSYEDFVEGLRPALNDDAEEGDLKYECRPGVFKRICTAAEASLTSGSAVPGEFALGNRRLFKMSLGDTYRPEQAGIYPECIQNGYVLLGYGKGLDFTGCNTSSEIIAKLKEVEPDIKPNDYNVTSVYYLIGEIHIGDLILVSDGNSKFRAIGEVTGDYEFVDRQGKDTFCQKRDVRWLRQFEQSQPIDLIFEKRLSQMTVYLMDQTSIKRPALEALLAPQKASAPPDKYVLIIDEFNRANISKVLGELITLLEIDKRIGAPEALTVRLPYSGKPFGVPNNLYVIGTMNTADRSIALMDTALRRRFDFREMEPDYKVLVEGGAGRVPFGDNKYVELPFVLMALNDRLEFLLGRDQRIGHSYFISVRTLEELNQRFVRQVLPLLQEFFYEDWSGIAKVLSVPNDVAPFISKAVVQVTDVFGAAPTQDLEFVDNQDRYVLAKVLTGDMYQGLHRGRDATFQKRLDAA